MTPHPVPSSSAGRARAAAELHLKAKNLLGAGVLDLLQRLEDLLRDQAADEATWHRNLKRALPFAGLAFALGWAFDARIGSADPFDHIAYPLMTVLVAVGELLLLTRRRFTTLLTLVIMTGNGVFFASKLTYVAVLSSPDISRLQELSETFYWVPGLYVLAANITRTPIARRICEAFFCVCTLDTLLCGFNTGQQDYGKVMFALVMLVIANITVYGLTLTSASHERTRTVQMKQMALTDTLTGLVNRLGLENELGVTLEQAQQRQETFALLFVDLDGFKAVNDTLGHDVGDALLREVAARLNPLRRGSDVLARLGGDEFVMLARGTTRTAADDIAGRMLAAMSQPFTSSQGLTIGASIGLSAFPADGSSAEALMSAADQRMYEVKRARKTRSAQGNRPRSIDVRQALAGQELRLTARQHDRPDLLSLSLLNAASPSAEEIAHCALLDGEQQPLLRWWAEHTAATLRRADAPAVFEVPAALLDPRFAEVTLAALTRHAVNAQALHVAVPAGLLNPGEGQLGLLGQLTQAGVNITLSGATTELLRDARTITRILDSHDQTR